MADTRLPLEVNARPLDTASPIRQANQDQQQNTLNNEKLLQEHFNTLDAREKSRLQSTVAGASQLKIFLDQNDIEGAHDFLMKRKQQLQGRIANGENIDTQETDAAIDMLRRGQVDELKNNVHGLLAAGQVYGILSRTDMPANVQEWQHYNSLSPADQERYLTMKRSNSVINLGGSQIVPSQVNPSGTPQASFSVTPKPEDQPDFKREQAIATAEGTGIGEANASVGTRVSKSSGLLTALENLKTSAANAPSGMFEGAIATTANKTGLGGEVAKAQGDFSVKRAAAENAIRETFRVVGSGATSDRDAVPFIQMLPEESDSADVKIAKTNAAMEAVKATTRALAASRGLPDPFMDNGGQGERVVVSNGKETFEIDAADLPAAEAEGFKRR